MTRNEELKLLFNLLSDLNKSKISNKADEIHLSESGGLLYEGFMFEIRGIRLRITYCSIWDTCYVLKYNANDLIVPDDVLQCISKQVSVIHKELVEHENAVQDILRKAICGGSNDSI